MCTVGHYWIANEYSRYRTLWLPRKSLDTAKTVTISDIGHKAIRFILSKKQIKAGNSSHNIWYLSHGGSNNMRYLLHCKVNLFELFHTLCHNLNNVLGGIFATWAMIPWEVIDWLTHIPDDQIRSVPECPTYRYRAAGWRHIAHPQLSRKWTRGTERQKITIIPW